VAVRLVFKITRAALISNYPPAVYGGKVKDRRTILSSRQSGSWPGSQAAGKAARQLARKSGSWPGSQAAGHEIRQLARKSDI
jgi:hypothetical protein